MSFTLIATDAALAAQCLAWSDRPWLAVDTEFVRVDTYYPKLCLVQLGDGRQQVCVDVLAVQDLKPLWDLLLNPRIIKVLHSASQDYELLVQLTGRCPAPLFDSQTAATLLGYGDQIGYAGLMEKLLGVTVDKSLSRTDWSRRPLSQAELAYAAADVEHLAAVYPRLLKELADGGRLPWLAEDCARVCEPALYRTLPADAWERLKGLARLPVPAQPVAAALAAWREDVAQARDRPRKWILDDEPLYRLAERQPQNLSQLQELGALPPKTLEKHGAALLEVIAAARQKPAQALALEPDLTPEQKGRLSRYQGQVREAAERLKLPAGFLAPKADLMALVTRGAAADIPLLKGWRREQLGAAMLETG